MVRKIVVHFEAREGGGLSVWAEDLPGLHLRTLLLVFCPALASCTGLPGSPLRQERDARADYDQATKAYGGCLNANPPMSGRSPHNGNRNS
jgi:hypothetical protein